MNFIQEFSDCIESFDKKYLIKLDKEAKEQNIIVNSWNLKLSDALVIFNFKFNLYIKIKDL